MKKRFSFLTIIAGAGLLVLGGCSEQQLPTSSEAPGAADESVDGIATAADLPEFHWGSANPITRLALGRSVHTDIPALPGGVLPFTGLRKHSFVAFQRQDDGTDASGWERLDAVSDNGDETHTRSRIVCMNTVPGTDIVVISSETTERSGTPPAGLPPLPLPTSVDDEGKVWAVQDNGRGLHAEDLTTRTIVTTRAFSKAICENPLAYFPVEFVQANLIPLEKGFIKVMDK